MVSINGVEMPLTEMSGVLVLEDPSGHQQWALIVDATVEYGDADFRTEGPQMKVIATMKPGELLRMTSTEEAGEENVLVYSRMLVHILREERDRYAKLEGDLRLLRRDLDQSEWQLQEERRAHVEDLHDAWREGARSGYGGAMAEQGLFYVLERNPHPLPDDEEDEL